jgi:hypothetical protein
LPSLELAVTSNAQMRLSLASSREKKWMYCGSRSALPTKSGSIRPASRRISAGQTGSAVAGDGVSAARELMAPVINIPIRTTRLTIRHASQNSITPAI